MIWLPTNDWLDMLLWLMICFGNSFISTPLVQWWVANSNGYDLTWFKNQYGRYGSHAHFDPDICTLKTNAYIPNQYALSLSINLNLMIPKNGTMGMPFCKVPLGSFSWMVVTSMGFCCYISHGLVWLKIPMTEIHDSTMVLVKVESGTGICSGTRSMV